MAKITPPSTNEAIEYGKDILLEQQRDIIPSWGDELLISVLLAVAGVLCMRLLKKIDDTHALAVSNSNDLYDYKLKTSTLLAEQKTEIQHLKAGLEDIKHEQKETNRRLEETNRHLNDLIVIQRRAHGIDE